MSIGATLGLPRRLTWSNIYIAGLNQGICNRRDGQFLRDRRDDRQPGR